MPKIKIVDLQSGQEIEREMNAEELAQWEADKARLEAETQAKIEASTKRQFLLEKLGITEEEAKLLLS